MYKFKVEYLGPDDCVVLCQSFNGKIKKGDVINITEQELLELGEKFKRVSPKKGEKIDV